MFDHFKKEFQLKNLSLNYNNLVDDYDEDVIYKLFYSSFWPFINRLVYTIYRVFIAFYYTIWFVESIIRNLEFREKNVVIRNKNGTVIFILHPWPLYMTNWSLTILLLHLWSITILTIYFFNLNESENLTRLYKFLCKKDPQGCANNNNLTTNNETQNLNNLVDNPNNNTNTESLEATVVIRPKQPCFAIRALIPFSWLLYNLSSIAAIVVTTSYFSYVYINDLQVEPTIISQIGNLHRHGINTIVILIDVAIISYPVRFLHFVYTLCYGFIYTFVTFIYWCFNPQANIIYVTLDYNKPILTVSFFVILCSLTVLLQLAHYSVYRLKLYIRGKFYAKTFA